MIKKLPLMDGKNILGAAKGIVWQNSAAFRSLSPHDAEDCIQEVVIGMLEGAQKADPKRYPRAFQWQFGRWKMMAFTRDAYRNRKRMQAMTHNNLDDANNNAGRYGKDPLSELISEERNQIIEKGMNELRDSYPELWKIVQLRYFDGLKQRDICKICNITRQKARIIERKIIRKLSELL
jgi:RNA polymerase sigma factor (sigma-70 family)